LAAQATYVTAALTPCLVEGLCTFDAEGGARRHHTDVHRLGTTVAGTYLEAAGIDAFLRHQVGLGLVSLLDPCLFCS